MNIDPIDPTERDRWEPPSMKALQQLAEDAMVGCACGRQVNADMMRLVGDAFVCDACLDRSYREGALTREDYARSQGAPDNVIALAQHLDALQMDRELEVAARAAPRDVDEASI